jgi:hypothetical protein
LAISKKSLLKLTAINKKPLARTVMMYLFLMNLNMVANYF